MLAIIGATDLTKDILSDSYDVQLKKNYEEWADGNYQKHRIYTADKIKGSFSVICGTGSGISTEDFLELLEENTENNVLTITLYVTNTGEMESIQCFYELGNSKFFNDEKNVFSLKLEEC